MGKRNSYSAFSKKLLSLTGRFQTWQIWRDFITMFATAISNQVDPLHTEEREGLYLKTAAAYTSEELEVFSELIAETIGAILENPERDFLGEAYMELELQNHWVGQFFTPYQICHFMASINMGASQDVMAKIKQQGYFSVSDPACGAGAMLIAAANIIRTAFLSEEDPSDWQNHVLLVGQDIDHIAGLMCYIQLSVLGVPGFVKIGDTLADPIHWGDDLTNYWFTPGFMALNQTRRIGHEKIKEIGA